LEDAQGRAINVETDKEVGRFKDGCIRLTICDSTTLLRVE